MTKELNVDDDYFKNYRKVYDKIDGIPNVQMNAPPGVTAAFKGQIGLELEMEAMNALPREAHLDGIVGAETGAQWTTHEDGSLRGSAIEYVLSQPCAPREIEPLVESLYSALLKHKTVLHNSNRCSTHVHKNVSGKTVNLITSALALFVTFEDVFIPWCGEERVNNHFCLANRDSPTVVSAWNNFLRTGQGRFDRSLKYTALNIVPIFDRGSMEVRCGPIPDTPERVVKWARFVDRFFDYAFTEFRNPSTIAYALSERGGYALFKDICGEELFPLFMEMTKGIDQSTIDKMALEGFRRCQSIVLGHPWEKWMTLIEREYVPDPFGKTKKKSLGIDAQAEAFLQEMPEAPRFRAGRARRAEPFGVAERAAPDAPIDAERNAQPPRWFAVPNPNNPGDNIWRQDAPAPALDLNEDINRVANMAQGERNAAADWLGGDQRWLAGNRN